MALTKFGAPNPATAADKLLKVPANGRAQRCTIGKREARVRRGIVQERICNLPWEGIGEHTEAAANYRACTLPARRPGKAYARLIADLLEDVVGFVLICVDQAVAGRIAVGCRGCGRQIGEITG